MTQILYDGSELRRLSRALRQNDLKEFQKPLKAINRKWANGVVDKSVKLAPTTYGINVLAKKRTYGRQVGVSKIRVFIKQGKGAGWASFPHWGRGGKQTRHEWLYRASEKTTTPAFQTEYARVVASATSALMRKGVKRF